MEPSVGNGIVAGLAGGLVAAWVMNEFQAAWTRAAGSQPSSSGGREKPGGQDEMSIAAPVVHYAFGAATGAIFGGLVEHSRPLPPFTGAAWGTALWAVADEIAVPMLHLSRPSTDYPPEAHLQAFAAHIVYGVTTELVQLGVRAAM
jgi:putative membrane protein